MNETIRIGLRNLTRNFRRSLLTGTMVALGVAALLFFRGYISALNEMMIDMVVNTLTAQLQVEREGVAQSIGLPPLELDLPESLSTTLHQTSGIEGVAPRIRFGAFLVNGEKSSLVSVLAVDPAQEKKVSPRGPGAGYAAGVETGGARFGVEGVGLTGIDDDTLIIGTGVASALGLKLGDTAALIARTQKGSTDAIDGVVRGINSGGDPELNKRLVVMSLGQAQRLLHMTGRVTSFAISAPTRAEIPQTLARLRTVLATTETPTEVRTWEELSPYYRDVIILQNNIMTLVMAMVFALALAGITNTMMMSVFERQREVGTLMALGFRRKSILFLFLIEALGLGLAAALTGAVLGAVVIVIAHAVGIPFIVPAVGTIIARPVLDVGYGVLAVTFATYTALAAGIYPAYRASRLQPVEALRAL